MIETRIGDILKSGEGILCHQVNCFGFTGGPADAVFRKYPTAEAEYHKVLKKEKPRGLLGTAQFVDDESGRVIANAFGQFYPGQDYRPESLKSALHEVALFARKEGLSVAVPYKISCGICGGDWDEVQKILAKTMKNVRCVIYRRPED